VRRVATFDFAEPLLLPFPSNHNTPWPATLPFYRLSVQSIPQSFAVHPDTLSFVRCTSPPHLRSCRADDRGDLLILREPRVRIWQAVRCEEALEQLARPERELSLGTERTEKQGVIGGGS